MQQDQKEYYGKYAEGLEALEETVLTELRKITRKITDQTGEMPVEHVRSRIKGTDSLLQKLEKKGEDTDVKNAISVLSDIIGLRIVTHFVGEVYEILQEIQGTDKWDVVKVKDYISDPKPNGYRSLHVIIGIKPEKMGISMADINYLQAEIQMRTIAMDCWASLEHEMKYKREIENAALIIQELKRCADEMASTDLSMQTIRQMIKGK